MKITCAPDGFDHSAAPADCRINLYGTSAAGAGSIGGKIIRDADRFGIVPSDRVRDFLSISLSVVAGDHAVSRNKSPDGWTREIALTVAVLDPDFWETQRALLEKSFRFLTTDLWQFHFVQGAREATQTRLIARSQERVCLLSGGLDSLVGAIDATRLGAPPLTVSKVERGDEEHQRTFAARLGLTSFATNHCVEVPEGESSTSQRARSIGFLALGILAASGLSKFRDGGMVELIIPENGFISLNPPLTSARIGSLSTRTTHPLFLHMMQELIRNAGITVNFHNPYRHKTKGEMLAQCRDTAILGELAGHSTSCGRFHRHGYVHCGRCIPCLVRRSAFLAAGINDQTPKGYKYFDLQKRDDAHAWYEDVRAAAMAVIETERIGFVPRLRANLPSHILGDVTPLEQVAMRGLAEVANLLRSYRLC